MAEPLGLGDRFQRRFLAARQLRSFPWEELEQKLRSSADPSLPVEILHKTVLHPLSIRYPPPTKYRRCFLRELIKKHEATTAEPLDDLYEALAGILNEEESTQGYKSYLLPTGAWVTLAESVAIISGGTTGLVTWEAALHLAEWAMENVAVFSQRTVLELGSGIGFTGIAICKTCSPKTYIFSDCHPCVLQQLRENIHLNGFVLEPETSPRTPTQPQGLEAQTANSQQPEIIVAELDWGSVTEKQVLDLHPDVVLAADVVYDPEITSALIGVLQKLRVSRGARKPPEVYIASTLRNPDTFLLFQAELGEAVTGVFHVSNCWRCGNPTRFEDWPWIAQLVPPGCWISRGSAKQGKAWTCFCGYQTKGVLFFLLGAVATPVFIPYFILCGIQNE